MTEQPHTAATSPDSTPHVNHDLRAWFDTTVDPRTAIVAALCEVIEAADPRAVGEIKWNAPSYRISEHFATTGLGRGSEVRLVLHRGAKKTTTPRPSIDDPHGLLDWKAPDRAVLQFRSERDVRALRDPLTEILRQWIDQTQ